MKMTADYKIRKAQKEICRVCWALALMIMVCIICVGEPTIQFRQRIAAVYNAPVKSYTVKDCDNYGRLARRLNAEMEHPLPETTMISIIRDLNENKSLSEGEIILLPYLEESTI